MGQAFKVIPDENKPLQTLTRLPVDIVIARQKAGLEIVSQFKHYGICGEDSWRNRDQTLFIVGQWT